MIIKRYLAKEVFITVFAVTFILLLAFLCQQTVRYLNYVAIGKIPTNILLELISFEIPYLLALLLPLGLYLGIILAFGRIYTDNEMAVLQMCGFDRTRLRQLTLFIGVIISALILFLMLWVNPWVSAKRQEIMASDEATLHLIQTLIPGRFQVSPDGHHVMYVETLSRDHKRAKNVFLAQEKTSSTKQSTWMLVLANEGYQAKDKASSDQMFVTDNGYRYEGVPGENDYKIIQFKKYSVRIPQAKVKNTHEEIETLSVKQLFDDYINPKRAAELQWRFSVGIAALLLALLAIPFSAVRPRQGRYLILIPAILIYIVYFNLLFISRHWVEQGFISPLIGMWWVHGLVLFFISLVYLFRKAS